MARVTIKDLAKASGLSVCTINKALYNKPWVSDVTRRRVLELAEQLGYQPNRLAQSLARRTLSLAVLYPQFWGHWFDPLVDGVRQGVNALQDHNISVQFCQLQGSPSHHNLPDVLTDLVRDGVDGVILCSGYMFDVSAGARQSLSELTMPIVLLGGSNSVIPHVTCVRADARRCGRMAGELLGLLTGGAPAALIIGQRDIVDHQEKVEGFTAAATYPIVGVYETADDPEARAYEAMAAICTEHPETRGVYVAIDNGAEGVARYLRTPGAKVDMTVIGTGVYPEMRTLMTEGLVRMSIFQNTQEQGRLAVQTLFRYLSEGHHPDRELLVPPYIAVKNNIDLWL